MSSRKFLTDEAQAIGLVHRLVDKETLVAEAHDYAVDMITRCSPESLRQTKRQIYLDWHRDVGASVQDADQLLKGMVKQPNYKQAIAAFMEKRNADWEF